MWWLLFSLFNSKMLVFVCVKYSDHARFIASRTSYLHSNFPYVIIHYTYVPGKALHIYYDIIRYKCRLYIMYMGCAFQSPTLAPADGWSRDKAYTSLQVGRDYQNGKFATRTWYISTAISTLGKLFTFSFLDPLNNNNTTSCIITLTPSCTMNIYILYVCVSVCVTLVIKRVVTTGATACW